MWGRYGGNGEGVCLELEVPDELLGNQFFRVEYLDRKSLAIDQMLRASYSPNHAREVYSIALLSKPMKWAPEGEVRFISKRQDVSVEILESNISKIIFGKNLPKDKRERIMKRIKILHNRILFS
jgi:hypothetical protein